MYFRRVYGLAKHAEIKTKQRVLEEEKKKKFKIFFNVFLIASITDTKQKRYEMYYLKGCRQQK